jgi:serine/threonine protein kinase/tetratricopeptide (TPR) repeat protein
MHTSPEKWEAVKALFDAVLELTPPERQAFLRARSADDSVRSEVQRLVAEYEEAGTFLSIPALAAIPLSPKRQANRFSEGECLGGRFKILRFVAEGGMGEVYEAEDLELHELVAIKTLRPETLQHTDALARFKREVHLARKVTHPNVCRIFDLYRHKPEGGDEVVILSMEFLRGETLAERIKRRGRMSIEEALPLIGQMASALSAAHEAGIVHRDFKPSNVVLVQEPAGLRAVVTDFGLAFRETTHSGQHTLSGPSWHSPAPGEDRQLCGTPAYMAPEQIEGHPATIASDIYAFGLVIYETVTGVRPFQGDTPMSTAVKRLMEAPPPPRRFEPSLSPACESVILRCLERDPASRFAKAQDVPAALAGDVPEAKSGRLRPATFATSPKARRSKWTAIVGVSLVIVGLVGALYAWRARQSPKLARDAIVLADFTNTTGDPVFDDTLKHGLAIALEQSPFLNILSDQQVNETLKLMGRLPGERLTPEVTREVCQREGANGIVSGRVASLGTHYVIGLEAVDCHTGAQTARAQAEAESQEAILSALDKAAASLRAKLGESADSVKQFYKPLGEGTTSSLEALKLFTQADQLHSAGRRLESIPFLKKAIELDPNFALAHAELGETYYVYGESNLGAPHITTAFQLSNRVSAAERLWITQLYYGRVIGDHEKELANLKVWEETYPDDFPPHNLSATIYAERGQYDKAISEYQRAIKALPHSSVGYENLARALIYTNRYEDAKEVFQQELANSIEDNARIHDFLYQIAFIQNDSQAMTAHVAWVKGKPQEHLLGQSQAQALEFLGKFREARELWGQATKASRRASLQENAANAAVAQAVTEVLAGEVQSAVKLSEGAISETSSRKMKADASLVLALAGNNARAQTLVHQIAAKYPADTLVNNCYLPLTQSMIELHQGQPERALRALEPLLEYEFGAAEGVLPNYLRGLVYLQMRDGKNAKLEFQKVLTHRGLAPFSFAYALSYLGVARAAALTPDKLESRKAYADFFSLWKDADPDTPILKQAKTEYANLK